MLGNKNPKGRLLEVKGIGSGEIAYNPAVIVQNNTKIIAARIESLNSHWLDSKLYDPHIMFFTRQDDHLVPIPGTPVFRQYEDPSATWILGENNEFQLLFGGVKVDYSGDKPVITTQLHLAPSVQELDPDHPFAQIRGMKDVRFAQLPNRQIAVFTRPTCGEASPGRIGLKIIDRLDDIKNPETLNNVQLLKFNLDTYCKMGVNEAFFVESTGLVHVFCHIASVEGNDFDNEKSAIHYAGYEFDINPKSPFDGVMTSSADLSPRFPPNKDGIPELDSSPPSRGGVFSRSVIKLSLVAKRSDFPKNSDHSKGPRFDDVLFPGGTGGYGQKEYFAGLEDALIGVMNL